MSKGLLLHILVKNNYKQALFQNVDTREGVLFTEESDGWTQRIVPEKEILPDEFIYRPLANGWNITYLSHFEANNIFSNFRPARSEINKKGQQLFVQYVKEHTHVLDYKEEEFTDITEV